ncbi:aldose epimerase family protein [Planococcus sp. APC 3906]|uniref:aldose epimerase family protein n=1 Tax=Planococcus sp. APC 3906 TaxID=3035194 RepID=UPI0025B4D2AF|nr:aldose epimerase family protein [Planococcus sp. APC 3906]MDN3449535.1 aldose epimerase family protein [Planococcus sp. APC 3906]
MKVEQRLFGQLEGRPVTLFTIENANGFRVSCINWGCIITGIMALDRHGKLENVVLGFETLEEYGSNPHFLGAVAGRFAGRIKGGAFSLEGKHYQLAANAGGHHLHGGNKGFSHVLWDSNVIQKEDGASIEFTYLSPDGEEGYPGNLKLSVTYSVRDDTDELAISYSAISDQTTLVNLTNHSYFNLSGNLKRDILKHRLTLDSCEFLELDKELIPTGELLPVANSVFDFRNGRKIYDGTVSGHPQNLYAGCGYDHPFILGNNQRGRIKLEDEESGRKLRVETTEPTVVLYTGNSLKGSYSFNGSKACNYLGLCLETQGLPDSVHQPHFPSAILEKGERYTSETRYTFGIMDLPL